MNTPTRNQKLIGEVDNDISRCQVLYFSFSQLQQLEQCLQCQQRWICEQQQLQQQQLPRARLDGTIMLQVKLRSSADEQRLEQYPEYIIIHLIMVYSGCIGSFYRAKKGKEQNITTTLNNILQVDAFSSKENLTISSQRRINKYDCRCGTREVATITA